MNWSHLQSFTLTGGAVWQGVDFYIADSTNSIKLGFAATATTTPTTFDGTLFFIVMNNDGSGLRWSTVDVPTDKGCVNPSIVSDGYYYIPGTTNWYIAYQYYNPATPTNNPAKAALTPDWGTTWTFANVRTGYNDYDLDIDVISHPTGDSVYCVLTNNLTQSNPNLRLRKVALSAWGTVNWSQYNPATSTAPEYYSSLAVGRSTGDMVVSYTIVTGGVQNIACTFTNQKDGFYFQAPYYIANEGHNESMGTMDCNEKDGYYRFIYIASSATHDSVIYKSFTEMNNGFVSKYIALNPVNNAKNTIFPSVAGGDYMNFGTHGFGIFAGAVSGLLHNSTGIIPVELTSFKAFVSGNNILLNWSTSSETNNHGFAVEYKSVTGNWTEAGFVSGNGTTTEIQNYSFNINGLNSGKYFFRLKQVDFDGTYAYSNEVEGDVTGDISFELLQNYPNPFNPSTEIMYSIKEKGFVSIKIYDLLGREISTLVNEVKDAGLHSVGFNGSGLASGVYMYSISVNEFNTVKKMILNK
jgi:hypothetical protein